MNVILSLMLVLATQPFVQAEHWKHGPTFGWRTYRGQAYIASAETSLIAGQPPKPATPRLALWPGMDTLTGLVQPIIVSTANEYLECRSRTDQWCVFASYLNGLKQQMGRRVLLDGKDVLTMKFNYSDSLDGYDQQLFIKGKLVSSLKTRTGKSKGFYTDVECQGKHQGVINAHKYINTTIVLSEADPSFGKAPSNHYMACADKISTIDGGKTWLIPTIKISESEALKDFDGAHQQGPILCRD